MSRPQIPECRTKHYKGMAVMVWPIACCGCKKMTFIKRPRHMKLGKDIIATSEASITKALDGLGWSYKKHLHHIKCTRCTKEEKTMPTKTIVPMRADPPREITREVRRKIADLLEEVYLTKEGMYADAESDVTVGETLKYPAAWVADVRVMLFGDGGESQKGSQRSRDIDLLEAKLSNLEHTFTEHLKTFRSDIEKLRG